uniref:HFX-2341-like N-terminal domain-containing protein n=1 Tax=Promethearchaeum syntrophicum TaxID=2594042 RepID=A0A5B9DG74_9ARCH|nr:DUF6293 family protein [Candidatus Prometheoarchaeum syntrophicum]QEE17760.1 hypothetical protein DSAG12_03598 [Candidatus Prometheoarchaeum syntrophicum]
MRVKKLFNYQSFIVVNFQKYLSYRDEKKIPKKQKRIHIVPIGLEKIERFTDPSIKEKADRIYLIKMTPKNAENSNKEDKIIVEIKNKLIKNLLIKEKEIIVEESDLYDYMDLMKTFARIIRIEQKNNNEIWINVSTGGKFSAIAAMTSCMMFEAEPFYCKTLYGDEERNIDKDQLLTEFPQLKISIPNIELNRLLLSISSYFKVTNRNFIRKAKLLKILNELELKFEKPKTSKQLWDWDNLVTDFLDPLIEKNLLEMHETIKGRKSWEFPDNLWKDVSEIYIAYSFSMDEINENLKVMRRIFPKKE